MNYLPLILLGGLTCYVISVAVWLPVLSRVEVSLPIRSCQRATS